MGDSTGWWQHWLSDLALKHEAIIVSPNYRLLPGATSAEIYDDVEDFWKWLHSPEFSRLLEQNPVPIRADLDRILTHGESAGGLLSLYIGLAHPNEIRAITAAYPMLDPHPKSVSFAQPRAGPPMGVNTDKKYLGFGAPAGTVISSAASEDHFKYMLAVFEHQTLGEIYARGSENVPAETLYPFARLEQSHVQIPEGGIAILGSYEDSLIPVQDLERFVKRAREVTKGQAGNDKIVLSLQHGEHGFDLELRLTEKWLQDVLKQAVDAWLNSGDSTKFRL